MKKLQISDSKILKTLKNKKSFVEKVIRESTIESKTVNYAKSKGWLVYKFTSPANRAVPDRIFIRHSIVFFIEFKAPGKKPTKLQKKVHDDINSHHVPVYVIDNFPLGKELVDSFEE
jgi:hypothetical protein